MNSPLEPASPASSSSESLTDDVAREYPLSSERSGFGADHSLTSTKGVAKRRLPGGSTKTTGNRDSKARRREEGSYGKGGPPDRRDPTKGKTDLLDVALFEALRKSMSLKSIGSAVLITLNRDRRPIRRRPYQACCLSVTSHTTTHACIMYYINEEGDQGFLWWCLSLLVIESSEPVAVRAPPDVCVRQQLAPCPRYTSSAPSLGCWALHLLPLVFFHYHLPSQVSMEHLGRIPS